MARSQSRGTGNTPADAAHIQWMELSGGLEIIDLKEQNEDIPFPAKHRWEGDDDDDDSPWKIPPPGRRCVGTAYVRDEDGDYIVDRNNKRITRPCWKHPMRGMKICMTHGGGVTRVRKAAVERLASSLDAVTGALVKIALNEDGADKDRISAINSIMDRVGVRAGLEIDIKDPGYLKVLAEMFEGASGRTEEEETEDDGGVDAGAGEGAPKGSGRSGGKMAKG